MKTVKLTKIAGKPDSRIKVGYAMEGPTFKDPEIGKKFYLDGRIMDSNGNHLQWFHTTIVDRIEDKVGGGKFIYTQNSTWLIEDLK